MAHEALIALICMIAIIAPMQSNNALMQSRLLSRRWRFTRIKCLHRMGLRFAGARSIAYNGCVDEH